MLIYSQVSSRGFVFPNVVSARPPPTIPALRAFLLVTYLTKGKRRIMKNEELEKEVEGEAARDEEVALKTSGMDNLLERE